MPINFRFGSSRPRTTGSLPFAAAPVPQQQQQPMYFYPSQSQSSHSPMQQQSSASPAYTLGYASSASPAYTVSTLTPSPHQAIGVMPVVPIVPRGYANQQSSALFAYPQSNSSSEFGYGISQINSTFNSAPVSPPSGYYGVLLQPQQPQQLKPWIDSSITEMGVAPSREDKLDTLNTMRGTGIIRSFNADRIPGALAAFAAEEGRGTGATIYPPIDVFSTVSTNQTQGNGALGVTPDGTPGIGPLAFERVDYAGPPMVIASSPLPVVEEIPEPASAVTASVPPTPTTEMSRKKRMSRLLSWMRRRSSFRKQKEADIVR